jgi:hypothetical protein
MLFGRTNPPPFGSSTDLVDAVLAKLWRPLGEAAPALGALFGLRRGGYPTRLNISYLRHQMVTT